VTVSNSATEPAGWNPPEVVLPPLGPDNFPYDYFPTTIAVAGDVATQTGYTLGLADPAYAGFGTVLTVSGTLTLLPSATLNGSTGVNNIVVGSGTLINEGLILSIGPQTGQLPTSMITIGGDPANDLVFGNMGEVRVGVNYSQHGGPSGRGAIVIAAPIDPASTGRYLIGAFGTLEIAQDLGNAATYDFDPSYTLPYVPDTLQSGGLLIIDNPGTSFDEAITDFRPGTGTIVVRGIGPIGDALLDPATHILRLYADSGATRPIYTFTDVDPGTDLGSGGAITSGGTGLIDMTSDFRADLTLACFAAGTRIATPAGEIAIDDLRAGDRVTILRGESGNVRWIGQRHIDLSRHEQPDFARPIRILARAFGEAAPRRDLLLSADHAVFVDDMLVPVRCLINGSTIRPDDAASSVTYFHIELAAHGVVLADGLPAETWLDTGNRAMFDNADRVKPARPLDYAHDACAELVDRGPRLDALRSRLADRAIALGHSARQEIALAVEQPGVLRLVLSPDLSCVRLVSACGAIGADRRRLGLLVSGLRLDGSGLPLRAPLLERGFHPPERHGAKVVCWTDGDAALAFAPSASHRLVEIEVAATFAKATAAAFEQSPA
jgi:hypothetical protein